MQSLVFLDKCLTKTLAVEYHDYRNIVFEKASLSKCLLSTQKYKPGDFKFLRLKSIFVELRFRDRLESFSNDDGDSGDDAL